MVPGYPDKCAPRVGVPVRRPLAEQVREEEQALTGCLDGRRVGDKPIEPLAVRSGFEEVGDPLQRAASRLHGGRRNEPTRHYVVEGHGALAGIEQRLRRSEGDPGRRAEVHVCAIALFDDAGPHRRERAVASPENYRGSRGEAGDGRRGRRDGPDNCRRGDDLRQQLGVDPCGGKDLGRPRAGLLVERVGSRGVRRVGNESSGEPRDHVVLGLADVRDAGERGRIVVAQPHDLAERVCGVELVAGDRVPGVESDRRRHGIALHGASRVGPDHRRPHPRQRVVEEHGAHHLPGESDDSHVEGIRRCGCQQRTRRRDNRRPPGLRILFDNATATVVGLVGHRDRRHQAPVVLVQGCLVSSGSEIVRDNQALLHHTES